jgi:uncharacterized membrane protein
MNPSPSADVSQPEAALRPFAVPLAVSLAVTAALAGASWWAWRQLPVDARIPSHWDAAGRIDSYGGRNSLFFVPGLMLGLTLLFLFVPRIEPRRTHLLLSSRAYRAVWLAMVLALAGLQVFQIRAAFGEELSMEKWHGIGLGALFIVIGNFLGKVRSNFLFGVRTPWTLSSELSWNKTHRLAGWVFVALGLTLFICAWLRWLEGNLHFVIIGGVVVLLATVLPYSYFVWRSDPDKAVGSSEDSASP